MKATSMVWSLDHLAYISLIGLIGLVVAGYGELSERLSPALRPLVLGTVSLLTVALAAISHHYAGVFANSETLWTYTLKKNPSSEIAHNNLGLVYLNSNRLPQAIEQFEASLKLRPDYAIAYNGLGNALVLSNRTEEAIADYREALRINPNYPEAHNGLANIFLQTGQLSDAQAESEKSLHLKPDYFEAHCTLGLILAQQGRTPEAIAQFETASRLNPSDPRVPKIIESLRAAPPASPGQK
jgi:tetratricopeptide (TPR) repeat protein